MLVKGASQKQRSGNQIIRKGRTISVRNHYRNCLNNKDENFMEKGDRGWFPCTLLIYKLCAEPPENLFLHTIYS